MPPATEPFGHDGPDPASGPTGAELGLALQWKAEAPPGVTTVWEPGTGPGDADALDDDPERGIVPCADPAWERTVALLAGDPEFLRRRGFVGDVALLLVVREAEEATLAAYPEDGPTTAVVLSQPAADYRGPDGSHLDADDRAENYLEAVTTLVVETGAALGLDDDEIDDEPG